MLWYSRICWDVSEGCNSALEVMVSQLVQLAGVLLPHTDRDGSL
jgi:hypothetical protein